MQLIAFTNEQEEICLGISNDYLPLWKLLFANMKVELIEIEVTFPTDDDANEEDEDITDVETYPSFRIETLAEPAIKQVLFILNTLSNAPETINKEGLKQYIEKLTAYFAECNYIKFAIDVLFDANEVELFAGCNMETLEFEWDRQEVNRYVLAKTEEVGQMIAWIKSIKQNIEKNNFINVYHKLDANIGDWDAICNWDTSE